MKIYRVQLKDNEGNILSLPSGYLESESYRRTVSVLQSQYTLLLSTTICKLTGVLLLLLILLILIYKAVEG